MPRWFAARNCLPSLLEEGVCTEIHLWCLLLSTGCAVFGQGSTAWRPVEIQIGRVVLIRVAV